SWQKFAGIAAVMILIAAAFSFFIPRIEIRKCLVAGIAFAAIQIFFLLRIPPVFQVHSAASPQPEKFTLNFSDHRVFHYTVSRKYYELRIDPGGLNELQDYDLRLTLSSDLEFADVYFDRAFGLQNQLGLVPSNMNDILDVHMLGDHFRRTRVILFTTKYHLLQTQGGLRVSLKSGGQEIHASASLIP